MRDIAERILLAGGGAEFTELYELIADIVCDTEDLEYADGVFPEGSYQYRLIRAFNACEAAQLRRDDDLRTAIAEYSAEEDTEPLEHKGRCDGL